MCLALALTVLHASAHMFFGAFAGHRTPGTAGNAALLQTPAAATGTASKSRLASSSGARQSAGAFETPAAKTPGTAAARASTGARATGAAAAGTGTGAGFKTVMASPAPLTIAKRGARGGRGKKGGGGASAAAADENSQPDGGSGELRALCWNRSSYRQALARLASVLLS
jgi:hypothetical protein